MSFYLLG